jgi:O-antigen/teichoic acid export membrane protein
VDDRAAEWSATGEGVGRNTGFALATQLTTSLFTAALTVFLVRALGPHGYGVFALAVGIGVLLEVLTNLGIGQATARFIAETRDDPREVASSMALALRLRLIAAGVVCLGLFAAAGPIASAYDSPPLTWPLRGIAIALIGQTVMGLLLSSFEALGRISLSLKLVFSESAIETAASVGLVLLGAGAAGAAFGRTVGYGLAAVLGLSMATRLVGRGALALRAGWGDRLRRLAAYAGALVIVDGVFVAFTQIDVLLVGAMIGTTSAGLFQAPLRLITFLQYPGGALAAGIGPQLARTSAAPNVTALQRGLRYLVILHAAIVAGLIVWAGPIADLVLGREFGKSAQVLRALAPYVFLSGIGALLSIGVNYLGEARRRIPIAIVTLLINFLIDLALIPKIGIVAGAIGTDVAYGLYVPAHFWICKRMIGLSFRPILVTFVRSAIAASAMAGVLLAVGTANLSVGEWLAGGTAAVAVFCAGLVLVGEVTWGEVVAIRARLSRAFRKLRAAKGPA